MGRPGEALLTPSDLGGFPHPLVEAGFLVDAGLADCVPCPCGCGHSGRVLRDIVGGEVRYSVFCAESGGLYDIPSGDLRLWKVSLPGIMGEIQRRFGCSDEPVERIRGLWYLGEAGRSVAGRRRQIFFAERISPEVESVLPDGDSQILIVGEIRPDPITKFRNRIFQMHELLRLDGEKIRFDMELIENRLPDLPKPKTVPVVPKNARQKSREEIIKDFLKDRALVLRDAYWSTVGNDKKFKMPRRPPLREIAEYIRQKTEAEKRLPESTVKRTIEASTDKELLLLWNSMEDVSFIRDYRRKKKRSRRDDEDGGDEEFLAEMFGQTAPEPPGGYHVV